MKAKQALQALLELAFPPCCFHCQKRTEESFSLFCSSCIEQLIFLNKQEYCPYCLEENMPCPCLKKSTNLSFGFI